MKKNLIYSVFIDDRTNERRTTAWRNCLESQRLYAESVDADVFVQEENVINLSDFKNDEKLNIFNILADYERVLYLDADILCKYDAPNIFKMYPNQNLVYMLNETCFNHTIVSRDFMPDICRKKPEIAETVARLYEKERVLCYYNAGVILASNPRRELFNYSEYFKEPYWRGDQDYINYRVWKQWQEPIFNGEFVSNLPLVWNGMTVYDPNALKNCHFVHYAGCNYEKAIMDFKEIFK